MTPTSVLARQLTQRAVPRGLLTPLAAVYHLRAAAALARGDFEAVCEHATAVSPPGVFTPHLSKNQSSARALRLFGLLSLV